jgi:hypothetical protein
MLTFISPDLPREEWVSVAFAVYDALESDGFDLFDEWSRGGKTYNAASCKSLWKSLRRGKVGFGTLIHKAKKGGLRREDCETDYQGAKTDRQEDDRKRQEQKAEEEAIAGALRGFLTCQRVLEKAPALQPDHRYFIGKGVDTPKDGRELPASQLKKALGYAPKSGGVRLAGRVAIIPVTKLVPGVGEFVTSLELIDETGRKTATRGAHTRSGGYWAAQPLPEGDGAGLTLAIGEGVATVLSAKEATGYAVIAALSAGNLPKVAAAMRARYPAARLLILSDLGNGQEAAKEAARTTGAARAIPSFTPEQIEAFPHQHGKPPTDFNDLHQIAGPEAVRAQIEAAKPCETAPEVTSTSTTPVNKWGVRYDYGLKTQGHDYTQIDAPRLPALNPNAPVLLVKSGMGTGKTHQLETLVQSYLEAGLSVLAITHLTSLAGALVRRLHMDDYRTDGLNVRESRGLVICVNSLWRIAGVHFDVVILDESEQFIRAMASPELKYPAACFAEFERLIRGASNAIALDGQMSALTVSTLEKIRPGERFQIIENVYKTPKTVRMMASRRELWAAADEALRRRATGDGKRVAFCCASKKEARAFFLQAQKNHPDLRGQLICSETSGNPMVRETLTNFDENAVGLDYVVASPSLSTGVSVDKLDFDVYGSFSAGIVTFQDVAQAVSRFRRADSVTAYVAEGRKPENFTGEQLDKARRKLALALDIPGLGEWIVKGHELRTAVCSAVFDYNNAGKWPLQREFLALADEIGWTVELITSNPEAEETGKALSALGRQLEEEDYTATVNGAETITDDRAAQIDAKHHATSEEKAALEKHQIARFYCKEVDADLVREDGRGKRRQAVRLLELVGGDESAIVGLDAEELLKGGGTATFKARTAQRHLLGLVLSAVGLPPDLPMWALHQQEPGGGLAFTTVVMNPDTGGISTRNHEVPTWTRGTLNMEPVAEIWERRIDFRAVLGLAPGHDFEADPLKFINRVLREKLGLPVTSYRPGKGRDRPRFYRLDTAKTLALRDLMTHRRNALVAAGEWKLSAPCREMPPWSEYVQYPGMNYNADADVWATMEDGKP